jgi:hypothetical protein
MYADGVFVHCVHGFVVVVVVVVVVVTGGLVVVVVVVVGFGRRSWVTVQTHSQPFTAWCLQ